MLFSRLAHFIALKGQQWFIQNRYTRSQAAFRLSLFIDRRNNYVLFKLAQTYRKLGQTKKAASIFHSLTSLQSQKYAAALAYELAECDCRNAAVEYLKDYLLHNPNDGEGHHVLGSLLQAQADFPASIEHFTRALSLTQSPDAQFHLGHAYLKLKKYDIAIFHFQSAERSQQWSVAAAKQIVVTLIYSKNYVAAEEKINATLHSTPHDAELLHNLGVVQLKQGKLHQSERNFKLSSSCDPKTVWPQINLHKCYLLQGRINHALRYLHIHDLLYFTKIPDKLVLLSNYLYSLNFVTNITPEHITQLHKDLAKQHFSGICTNANNFRIRTANRTIRVGYVSPDFRNHSVSYFLYPIISNHDKTRFKIFCYSDVKAVDETTKKFRQCAEYWRDVSCLNDDYVTELILRDKIDILVDLAGHTENNRLSVFARRAAPIQITYLGYPNTTGLTTIDYRITDIWADPQSEVNDQTESLLRIDGGFLCYRPPSELPPITNKSTHLGIRFGSFCAFPKLNREVLSCWAKILREIPGSTLTLKNRALSDPWVRKRFLRWIAILGIEREKIRILTFSQTLATHLATYNEIDVSLDTFPYNGTTTTCEALAMGVPVVTLAQNHHAARVGMSLLKQVGLPELIAHSMDEYIKISTDLASNSDHLYSLWGQLRPLVLSSNLCNARNFTTRLEAAYLDCINRGVLRYPGP